MPQFETRRLVKHSPDRMYALVADIERYPEFLPLCEALTIRSRRERDGKELLLADMTVGYKAIRETFTTRARFDLPHMRIMVEYLDGPFKHLENTWHFKAVGEKATDVQFFITYEFRNRALSMLMGAMFDAAFRKFAEAFEHRADQLYGRTYQGLSASS